MLEPIHTSVWKVNGIAWAGAQHEVAIQEAGVARHLSLGAFARNWRLRVGPTHHVVGLPKRQRDRLTFESSNAYRKKAPHDRLSVGTLHGVLTDAV
jgi:hypothetical protein